MRRGSVAVVGSLNVDLVAHTDRLPEPGETVAGDSFDTVSGGKGANQALAAARAGAAVAMIGAVGNDHHASTATGFLEKAGIDLSGVRVFECPTGIAQIAVDRNGENTIIVVAGANGRVQPDEAVASIAGLKRGDVVLMQMEIPSSVNRAVMAAARSSGILSVFNTAPFTEDVPALAALADVVICNETEFALLAQAEGLSGTREDAACELANRNQQTIVVTLGKDGAFLTTGETISLISSIDVKAVDTVGAGDTFCGYLAAELARESDIVSAARVACVAGALSCTKPGAQTGIPDRETVQALC